MDKLTAAFAQFLEAAISEGFALPLHLAAVSANGSLTFIRYTPINGENADDGLKAEILAQHIDGLGFNLPVNQMLTDPTGKAALMLIEGPDTEPEFFWPDSLPSDSSH